MLLAQILLILLSMAFTAFFAGMETGVISIHRLKLRHFVRQGSRSARLLQGFLRNWDRLLGTTLVGTNIFMVIISVVSASLAYRWLGGWGEVGSTVAMSLLVLMFCEYLPKAWFRARPLERCTRFAGLLRLSELVLRPVAQGVVWVTRAIVPGSAHSFSKPAPFVTREDLKLLASEGADHGVLSHKERDMIAGVFALSRKRARDIMIPRADVTIVQPDMKVPEFFNIARSAGLTRFPVFDSDAGRFVGVVNVFTVLCTQDLDENKRVRHFMRPPLVIPEEMPVDDIFPRLRRSRQPMCLVQDKDENITGLITTEDIIEEIVGDL